MASALDWLRSNIVSVADLDDVSVASFMTLGATKMGSRTRQRPSAGLAPEKSQK
jgi:hypothetical protein